MKLKKEHKILLVIFTIVLIIRLFFAFKASNFSYDAYFALRHIEHIKENFFPLFNDPLSYSGRFFIFPPLFYYVLAFFNLFLPIAIVGKLLPNIFISALVIITYLIASEITKDKNASLFTAFIVGFIPVFYIETINNISVYSLVLPFAFLLIFFLIKINENKSYVMLFIFSLAILRLSHASVVLIMISLLLYLLIIKIERLKQSKAELELILFSTFIIVWSLFITFKNPFLVHGAEVIWQNIPKEILGMYFKKTTIVEAIYKIGIIPFITGIYIIYKYIFKEVNRAVYMLISLALTIFLLMLLKMIEPPVGFMFMGIVFSILFAQLYKLFFAYIERTQFNFKRIFLFALIAILIMTSVIPSINYGYETTRYSAKDNEINALKWLNANTNKNDVILATLKEGFLITAIAKRKNVADQKFLLISDAKQRLRDISKIYKTVFETDAVKILNKYNIKYIFFSLNAKKEFGIEEIAYIKESKCFEKVYDKEVKIYKSLCILEEK